MKIKLKKEHKQQETKQKKLIKKSLLLKMDRFKLYN